MRRRARALGAVAVAAALADAWFDAQKASRDKDLAGDVRGPAELAKWEWRIDQLLAAAPAGTGCDPDTDVVVEAGLTADAASWCACFAPHPRHVVRKIGLRESPSSVPASLCVTSQLWDRVETSWEVHAKNVGKTPNAWDVGHLFSQVDRELGSSWDNWEIGRRFHLFMH